MSVQFWVALDGDNRITINQALRGKQYSCLECKGAMIPKKGDIVSHHFAHKADFSCNGEGQKHLYVKSLIYEILVLNQDTLYLKNATIEMEKKHLGLIPDVCIKWHSGRLAGEYLAIEVWDKGESSDLKKATYGDNMIEFSIKDWGEQELGNPLFIFNSVYPIFYQKVAEKIDLRLHEAEKKFSDSFNNIEKKHKNILTAQQKAIKEKNKNILATQEKAIEEKNKELISIRNEKDSLLATYKNEAYELFLQESDALLRRRKALEGKILSLENELAKLARKKKQVSSVIVEGRWTKNHKTGDWLVKVMNTTNFLHVGTLCEVRKKSGQKSKVYLRNCVQTDRKGRRCYTYEPSEGDFY